MFGNSQGGDDVLISGTGQDLMWGDAKIMDPGAVGGADTFVFGPDSGAFDAIGDFRQSDQDLIDVSAYGFTDISDMDISDNGTDTFIEFDDNNMVTLLGFDDVLTNSDFIFV